MRFFRNKLFKVRDYECTNVVMCESDSAPSDGWEEISSDQFVTAIHLTSRPMQHLFTERGARYYGWL